MAAYGGERAPVAGKGNFAWDGDQWFPVLGGLGGMAMWLRAWGVPATLLTGRDVSIDFQSLRDNTIQGLMCSMGVATPLCTDATADQTLRHFAERVADSADTVGAAAGLLRSMGDVGAGAAVPATNTSMIRILELMLIALGGGGAIYGVTTGTATVNAAGAALTLDSGAAGGRDVSYVIDAVGVGGCTFQCEGSIDNVNWHVLNTVTVIAGGVSAQFQQNKFRYFRFNRTDAAGTNSTVTASMGR